MKKILCKIFGHKKIHNYFIGSELCNWDWFCERCWYQHPYNDLVKTDI